MGKPASLLMTKVVKTSGHDCASVLFSSNRNDLWNGEAELLPCGVYGCYGEGPAHRHLSAFDVSGCSDTWLCVIKEDREVSSGKNNLNWKGERQNLPRTKHKAGVREMEPRASRVKTSQNSRAKSTQWWWSTRHGKENGRTRPAFGKEWPTLH